MAVNRKLVIFFTTFLQHFFSFLIFFVENCYHLLKNVFVWPCDAFLAIILRFLSLLLKNFFIFNVFSFFFFFNVSQNLTFFFVQNFCRSLHVAFAVVAKLLFFIVLVFSFFLFLKQDSGFNLIWEMLSLKKTKLDQTFKIFIKATNNSKIYIEVTQPLKGLFKNQNIFYKINSRPQIPPETIFFLDKTNKKI